VRGRSILVCICVNRLLPDMSKHIWFRKRNCRRAKPWLEKSSRSYNVMHALIATEFHTTEREALYCCDRCNTCDMRKPQLCPKPAVAADAPSSATVLRQRSKLNTMECMISIIQDMHKRLVKPLLQWQASFMCA